MYRTNQTKARAWSLMSCMSLGTVLAATPLLSPINMSRLGRRCFITCCTGKVRGLHSSIQGQYGMELQEVFHREVCNISVRLVYLSWSNKLCSKQVFLHQQLLRGYLFMYVCWRQWLSCILLGHCIISEIHKTFYWGQSNAVDSRFASWWLGPRGCWCTAVTGLCSSPPAPSAVAR